MAKKKDDFEAVGGILDDLQFRLFDGLQIVPDEVEPQPEAPPKKVSAPNYELEKQGEQIAARPDEAELAFQARSMMQCTLPHRDPGKVPFWIRKNGDLSLILQPGVDPEAGELMGLPFGELPRLLLIWIVTEAVKTKSRHIKLNEEKGTSTLSGFLREIGADPGTGRGKRGDAKRVKEQMLRLFSCRISFKKSEGTAERGHVSTLNMEVASKSHLWWDFKHPEQGGLFGSEIELGEYFFKAITTNPIPIDLRAIIALKKNLHQSSFALDVYMWVTWRVHVMRGKKQVSVRIPLQSLKEQFGGEYTRLRDFKAAFDEALNNVWQVFPTFDYQFEKGIFILIDGKKTQAVPSRDPSKLKQRTPQPHKDISPNTRAWFAENYGEWSLPQAIEDFNYWLSGGQKGNPIEARSVNALFRKFVRDSWTKR